MQIDKRAIISGIMFISLPISWFVLTDGREDFQRDIGWCTEYVLEQVVN